MTHYTTGPVTRSSCRGSCCLPIWVASWLTIGVPALAQQPTSVSPATAPSSAPAADQRTQLPEFLWDSYVGLNVGVLANPFSSQQLEPGYRAGAITTPHAAFGIALFGHDLDEHLAVQVTYLRPVKYVRYDNVNGSDTSNSVWMAFGTLTLKARTRVRPSLSVYGEAGISLTNRRGFFIGDRAVVADAHFLSAALGGGIEHQINKTWDLVGSVTWIPSHADTRQPHALFATGGFRYKMSPMTEHRAAEAAAAGFIFPHQLISLGYATHAFGYGTNRFFAGRVPIFWGGKINVSSGAAVHYQRNVFHTAKRFAFDFGGSISRWQSAQNRDSFATLSIYPLFRFFLVRRERADFYLSYSLAGPTLITRRVIDDRETGNHLVTFQDALGIGFYLGRRKQVVAGVKISHYSNGNLLGRNPGIAVPVTFELGYAF
jgi:lipid A 3-O-deacylase PagL